MFKNYVKIISILVCFVIFLSACNNTAHYTQSQSDEPISQPQTVYESTVSAENPDNLSQLMNGCGKTVTVYGELNASRYSDAISELQTVLDSYSRNISLAVYSLNSDRALAYNTETAIFGACTVKAARMRYMPAGRWKTVTAVWVMSLNTLKSITSRARAICSIRPSVPYLRLKRRFTKPCR